MFDPHSLSRTSPPDQPFDLETIEAMSRAYQAACRKLDLADRDDVAQHVIELAQTGVRNPTALYRLTGEGVPKKGPVSALMVTQMRQHSLVWQKFRYVGVIAVILIVTVALCWGLTHISI
jgi:hypothetical protein